MKAALHATVKPIGLLLLISYSTVLVVQVAGRAASRAGGVASPAELPRFDRVLLLEETSESTANVSMGDLGARPTRKAP